MNIYKFSFKFFRGLVRKSELLFKPLTADLRKAHLTVPVEQWASLVYFVTCLAFLISYIICVSITWLFGFGALSTLVSLPIATAISAAVFAIAYFYPRMLAEERKKRIENALSFGALYLSTLARAGFPPQDMFKLLSRFKEYGELSKEAAKISNDVVALGLDLPTALRRAVNRSPSPAWTELLAGLSTTITVGGDLGKYLNEKAAGFVAQYKRQLQSFSNFLALLIEVYMTLVIIGAVLFVIVTSIMTSIGAVPVELVKAINVLVIAIGLPLLTLAFVLIVKGASPLEG